MSHKAKIDLFVSKMKQKKTRCKKEVVQGNRRIDALCKNVNVELKNNINDLRTKRSKNQIKDMTKTANRKKQGMVVQLLKENCAIPLNGKGKRFVKENKMRACRKISPNQVLA